MKPIKVIETIAIAVIAAWLAYQAALIFFKLIY